MLYSDMFRLTRVIIRLPLKPYLRCSKLTVHTWDRKGLTGVYYNNIIQCVV